MSDRNYGAIRDPEHFEKFVDRLIAGNQPFGFDVETGYTGPDRMGTSLQPFHPANILVGFSFAGSPEWARYVPLAHDDGNNVADPLPFARGLWKLLRTGNGVAHQAGFELRNLSKWFRKLLWNDEELKDEVRASKGLFPVLADSMIEAWLLAEYDPLRIGKDLKSLAFVALGLKMATFESLFDVSDPSLGVPSRIAAGMRRFNTRYSTSPKIVSYACEDSVASLALHKLWEKKIVKSNTQGKSLPLTDTVIFKVEMMLQPILAQMEIGPVDPDTGDALGNMLLDWPEIRRKASEVTVFGDAFGEELLSDLSLRLGRVVNINLNSPAQLAKVLYSPPPQGLGIPIRVKSKKTGAPSTSDDALGVLATVDPVIRKILTYRSIRKLDGSYIGKFDKELDYAGTGVVFPSHNQAGALTGRFSVDHVSYQQWPKTSKFSLASGAGFSINFRDLLICEPGWRIVGFDYSQIESRLIAALSGDRAMLEAYRNNEDIHILNASRAFRVPVSEVTPEQRQFGKMIGFATAYGSTAAAIAEQISSQGVPTTEEEAEKLLSDYYDGFPTVRGWMDKLVQTGRTTGFVETICFRHFKIWEYLSPLQGVRNKGDRMCVNATVQGSAADLIKLAMIRVHRALVKAGLSDRVRLFMTIHDALEFYVHESVSTQEVISLLNKEVSAPPVPNFPVKLRADWHEGKRWGQVAEIDLGENDHILSYSYKGEHYKSLEEFLESLNASKVATPDPVSPTASITEAPGYLPDIVDEELEAVVTLSSMPTRTQWDAFLHYVAERPGDVSVIVSTPEGSVRLDTKADIGGHDAPDINLILGKSTFQLVRSALIENGIS